MGHIWTKLYAVISNRRRLGSDSLFVFRPPSQESGQLGADAGTAATASPAAGQGRALDLRQLSEAALRGTEYASRACSGLRGLGNDLFYPAAMGGYAALVFAANRFRACARS